jgi:hypothetical protein
VSPPYNLPVSAAAGRRRRRSNVNPIWPKSLLRTVGNTSVNGGPPCRSTRQLHRPLQLPSHFTRSHCKDHGKIFAGPRDRSELPHEVLGIVGYAGSTSVVDADSRGVRVESSPHCGLLPLVLARHDDDDCHGQCSCQSFRASGVWDRAEECPRGIPPINPPVPGSLMFSSASSERPQPLVLARTLYRPSYRVRSLIDPVGESAKPFHPLRIHLRCLFRCRHRRIRSASSSPCGSFLIFSRRASAVTGLCSRYFPLHLPPFSRRQRPLWVMSL